MDSTDAGFEPLSCPRGRRAPVLSSGAGPVTSYGGVLEVDGDNIVDDSHRFLPPPAPRRGEVARP